MSANDELQAHTCEKMLQEYGNVANNVAQGNSQDLTEQWEKGELEIDRYYYVKYADGSVEIQLYVGGFLMRTDNKVIEVLAPVPSYEEYSRLEWYAGCGPDRIVELNKENRQLRKWCEEFNAIDVAKENQQLKTLLKEWMHFYPIILYEHEDTLKTKDIVELFDKTREILK